MLIAPVNHIKSMLGKQNPPNHGESRCLFPKDIKKRASVRERIRRMEKQKKALVEETARCDERHCRCGLPDWRMLQFILIYLYVSELE